MKIYTKKGDKGKTSLFSKARLRKNDPRIEAIGSIDELNSILGIIRSFKLHIKTDGLLEKIQQDLFVINIQLASIKKNLGLSRIDLENIKYLEKSIDEMFSKLPKLRNFIIYGGITAAGFIFFARAICRRAERRIAAVSPKCPKEILAYINRLSDFLFVLARFENFRAQQKEFIWKR